MGDGKDSSGLILGLVIGTFIALVLFGKKTQVLSTQPIQPMQLAQSDIQQPSPQYNWQPTDIPRVDDIKSSVVQQDSKLDQMESQLQKATSQLEQATSKLQDLQDTVYKLQQNNVYTVPQATVQQPITPQPIQEQRIYKNSEKWNIVRGKDGRIKSLDIARDVKKTG